MSPNHRDDPQQDLPNEALPAGLYLNEFELLRPVGVGGTSIVYLAQDHSLKRRVALKEYMPTSLASRSGATAVVVKSERHREVFEAGRKSFINEARLLAQFDHPSLIKVYRFWEANGTAYMVMPFAEGITLKDALRQRNQAPDEATLLQILDPLTQALAVIHADQCYHRDIAPDNIMMLAVTNRPLLLDFGAARRVIGDMTQALTVILKPGFAPIEQYADSPAMKQGPWTDIYALAAVVCFAITGKTPEPSVGRLIKDSLVPLRLSHQGRYSDRFLAAIDAALAVRPEARPQSISAFRQALGLQAPASEMDEPGTTTYSLRPQARAQADSFTPTQAPLRKTFWRHAPVPAQPAPAAAKGGFGWLLAPFALVGGALSWLWRAFVNPWGTASSLRRPTPPGDDPATPPLAPPSAPAEPDMRTVIRPTPLVPAPNAPPADEGGGHTVILPSPGARDAASGLQMQLMVSTSPSRASLGQVRAVARTRLVIGRRDTADLWLDDALASAEHAAIEWTDGGYWVTDLDSRNGTYVNGRRLPRLQREPLAPGASLQLGDTVITFTQRRDSPPPDLSGGEIADLYRLERCLRLSPKGAVYAAHHLRTGALVAVKLLASDVLAYPGYREQFESVVAASRRLQHPNICPVLDSGHGDVRRGAQSWPTTFLCYPLLSGGNLADRLADERPVAPTQAMAWLAAVASALAQAHRQGLVHGDLKPSAICFDGDANVYVTDFALATGPGSSAALMGSPGYMAPEQWDRIGVDARSDQFALAAMAYSLLAGAVPFEGQLDPRVRERNFLRGPIDAHEEALRHSRPPLSPAVSRVLRRALAVKPQDRFDSVVAFLDALQAAVEQGALGGRAPVFLSYQRSAGSTPLAHMLRQGLMDKHQIACFLDSQDDSGAGSFPEELAEAIRACRVFVCLLANTTLESDWVRKEIEIAHAHGRRMIPVLLESFVPPVSPRADEPAIHALLHSKGEPLSDAKGVLLGEGMGRVIRRVRETLARPAEGG